MPWVTSAQTTPGKISFYELSGPEEPKENVLRVQAEGWTYNNYATGASDQEPENGVAWWHVSDINPLQMDFYRETGGMKLVEGGDLNYAWKKVGYHTFTSDASVNVKTLIPSMTHTTHRTGLNYLDYYISCGSYNLVTASDHKIYLKIYEIDDSSNTGTDVTNQVTAQLRGSSTDKLPIVTINGEQYIEWTLKENQTDYILRFSGLKSDTLYALAAFAYPDEVDGSGNVEKGDWTSVVDGAAESGDSHPNVTLDNENFRLRTNKGVTLDSIRVNYINESYDKKGLEIQFGTDVYEGYEIQCFIYRDVVNGNLEDAELVYNNQQLIGQYTPENNKKFDLKEDYNYLEPSEDKSYSTGTNTFYIPFPPGTENRLTGGHNYTVVLKAVDAEGNLVNNPAEGADDPTGWEFSSQPVVISGTAAYAITNPAKASVTDGNDPENVLTINLQASDEMHQIVDDQYSLFVKYVRDGDGNPVESPNILGMGSDGNLYWMASETAGTGKTAEGITLGGQGYSIWKQLISVRETQIQREITLTGLDGGTYEVYTMAQIDLTADGPDTDEMVKQELYSQTVYTLTGDVMEGQVFTNAGMENSVSVMTLTLKNWENLDQVGSVMCTVTNAETGALIRTFADAVITDADGNNPTIKLTFDSKLDPGFYLITMSMTEKNGAPLDLSDRNRSLTVTVN